MAAWASRGSLAAAEAVQLGPGDWLPPIEAWECGLTGRARPLSAPAALVRKSVPHGTFQVYPNAPDLFVDVAVPAEDGDDGASAGEPGANPFRMRPPPKPVGADGKPRWRWVGTFRCDKPIPLNRRQRPGTAMRGEVFLLPGRMPTEAELLSGAFSRHVNFGAGGDCVAQRLAISTLDITKDASGAAVPTFVDSGATSMVLETRYKDERVPRAFLTGTVSLPPSTKGAAAPAPVAFAREVDGDVPVTLPMAAKLAATTAMPDGTPVTVACRVPRRELAARPDEARPVALRHVKSTACTTISDSGIVPGANVLLLGDISGSMTSGRRMECLRLSLRRLFHRACEVGATVQLAAWDSWVDFAPPMAQRDNVEKWIDGLRARGGNNMQWAVVQALEKFPAVDTVYVLCDGDVKPFVAPKECFESEMESDEAVALVAAARAECSKPETCHTEATVESVSWNSFRRRWPGVRFHFIGFGANASHDAMEAMGAAGDGGYEEWCEAKKQ